MVEVRKAKKTWSVLVDGRPVSHNIGTRERAEEIAKKLTQKPTEDAESSVEIKQEEKGFTPVFSSVGKKLIAELERIYPHPVLLIGETGWGKSVLVRHIATKMGLGFSSLNAHPGMDMGTVVGMWRPYSNGTGVGIKWQDGLLTDAIRAGKAFLFEELTRAPQDALSRLYGLLDNGFRSWSCPESGELVDVNPKFWFLSTANPSGQGYYTQKLDKALQSRFAATFEINSPIADEKAILTAKCPDKADVILKIVGDWRRKFTIPTRDIVQFAELIVRGFAPKRAAELAVAPKTGDTKGLLELTDWHI